MKEHAIIDGNTAATNVAYAFSEVAAIYPITPASSMGELADEWSFQGRKNMFGQTLKVIEMQSEAGAAGAVHGSLTAGALTTTFTASQGLLLMMPNMYKIAGELLPTVFHIAARSLATQSLSIFGDHSDVMAVRSTGFAMIASSSPQEAMDLAVISHLSTLESKIPFLHFFDGFRTSSEIQKVEMIKYETMNSMLKQKLVEDFRKEAIKPEEPYAKVGAQNPDVYFQGREASNKYYDETPEIVKKNMKLLEKKTGRKYSLFDYVGDKKADKIIISMGSSTETIEETVKWMNKKGEKVGAIKVRLYRPFSVKDFIAAIPETANKIAVLDRTKEPGAIGEPLYLDVVTALKDKKIYIIGGRYGLSSKEFTPSMVKAVFKHLEKKGWHGFTVGINDDLTKKSIPIKEEIDVEARTTIRCKFWGFGSDGTVSANKNSIKIIGENTKKNVQAYFSYDSKKSGGITQSFLRFGDEKIKAPYIPTTFDFIALHKHQYIGRYDILKGVAEEGIFLLNTNAKPEKAFQSLTKSMQKMIIKKKVRFYVIDALKIAKEIGLGNRINTVMQSAFFKLANIISYDDAVKLMKKAVEKTFSKKGKKIVEMNYEAIEKASAGIKEVKIPTKTTEYVIEKELIPKDAPKFIKEIVSEIMMLKGDDIPVSKMTKDGKVPTGTTKYEKRGIAEEIPAWNSEKCIQCGICSFVCPHSAIRIKQINKKDLKNAPKTFQVIKAKNKNEELMFKVQIYPEMCTGCGICIKECPTKALSFSLMKTEMSAGENENADFFDKLPDNEEGASEKTIKGSQLKPTMFEFSGACAGCGETPYIKLVTQLYGDRMIIANATGCSSIFGGTFPTIPYTKNKEGKGPAWANSLFEDNAEYGLGMRLAVDSNREQLKNNVEELIKISKDTKLVKALSKNIKLWNETTGEAKKRIEESQKIILESLKKAKGKEKKILKKINELKDYFIEKSTWSIGGDGWAYDIGFGGLDHVLATGKNINILVLDSEVYSNTGGQASKATPLGAVAKFAASGKELTKKNLGLMMMSYGYVYVASVNLAADKNQLIKAITEAESYKGPSIIIGYAACINHGLKAPNLNQEMSKNAAKSGYWPLYRFNPELKKPFQWDSKEPSISFKEYIMEEVRYSTLTIQDPERAKKLYKAAEEAAKKRFSEMKNK